MRAQEFLSRDACHVCGQTPCNCTHVDGNLTEAVANEKYILYFNGRPVAYYNNEAEAENQGRMIQQRVPGTEVEIKKEVCKLTPVELNENLRKWFKEKWVRFGPDGKIRGDCARGDDSEGKPKCLPQSKAHALGKKGRASAAARKRRQDPNPERSGKAINVATKKKTNEEQLDEKCWKGYHKEGNKELFGKTVPNCVKNEAANPAQQAAIAIAMKKDNKKPKTEQAQSCPECGGPMFSELLINEKQDACYYKVKSRYKVWPSAYASGALVQCRKKGAKNWGNKK